MGVSLFWPSRYQPSFHGVDLSALRGAAVDEYFRQPIVVRLRRNFVLVTLSSGVHEVRDSYATWARLLLILLMEPNGGCVQTLGGI